MKKILTDENDGTLVYTSKAVVSDIPVTESKTSVALPQTFTALAKPLTALKRYGLCTQASTPSPTSPVNIYSNVGMLGVTTVPSKEEVDENDDWLQPTYDWEKLVFYGKNLHTGEWEQGSVRAADGTLIDSNYRVRSWVKVKPSTQYTISAETNTNAQYTWVMQYKADGTYLGSSTSSGAWQNLPYTITTDANAAVIAVLICKNTGTSTTAISPSAIVSAQVEEGASATTFSQYAQHSLVPVLCSTGTKKDEADIITGTVTRKVSQYLFTGREVSWTVVNNAFRINISSVKHLGELLCTHFQVVNPQTYNTSNMPDGSVRMDATSDGYIYFRHDASNKSTGAFCAWLESQYLNGTPVMVVYERHTALTEHIDYARYNTVEGSNTIDSDSQVSAVIDTTYVTG